MHNQKKIQKIKQLLFTVLKETTDESVFSDIRLKAKQSIRIVDQIEKDIERKNKKIENLKIKKSSVVDPKLILKVLDDQIEQQKNAIDDLEKNKLNSEDKNIQTLFD